MTMSTNDHNCPCLKPALDGRTGHLPSCPESLTDVRFETGQEASQYSIYSLTHSSTPDSLTRECSLSEESFPVGRSTPIFFCDWYTSPRSLRHQNGNQDWVATRCLRPANRCGGASLPALSTLPCPTSWRSPISVRGGEQSKGIEQRSSLASFSARQAGCSGDPDGTSNYCFLGWPWVSGLRHIASSKVTTVKQPSTRSKKCPDGIRSA